MYLTKKIRSRESTVQRTPPPPPITFKMQKFEEIGSDAHTQTLYKVRDRIQNSAGNCTKVHSNELGICLATSGFGFEPHTGHSHDSSYDTSTGWIQEAD